MTVQELIDALSKLPKDATVRIPENSATYTDLRRVEFDRERNEILLETG